MEWSKTLPRKVKQTESVTLTADGFMDHRTTDEACAFVQKS